ncbi:hypothetical protein ED28_05855 [[Pantoea] beijingensis]|uniref:Uncharacterized protein n=1 Tax=[Pantoea] beijingensis TaxID=1324864 RepID=A0A443IFJ4_9GAMM|nr:hypothetical protein ED28_05855 [[Pantoea] beijingensis]
MQINGHCYSQFPQKIAAADAPRINSDEIYRFFLKKTLFQPDITAGIPLINPKKRYDGKENVGETYA